MMWSLLGYLAVMAIVYFVLPIAAPSADITLMQAAAITFLLYVARFVLTESITVRLDGVQTVDIYDGEDE